MDDLAITEYITTTFSGVEMTAAFGYTFFFYQSERVLPFATLIAADTEHDCVSNLDRPGVFRLNIGVSRKTFQSLFGPAKAEVARYDYTALDVIMPHPEYAAQSFICVLSPTEATFEQIRPLLTEAYDIAVRRFTRKNESG